MSHYVLLALVPDPAATRSMIDGWLAAALAPYDEGIEVAPYEKECYCVGGIAAGHGREIAEQQIKPMEVLRKEYWAQVTVWLEQTYPDPEVREAHRWDHFDEDDDVLPDGYPSWQAHLAEYTKVSAEAESAHPLFQKPNPKCQNCNGTGTYETTYNPASHWDWYVIGGRWTGALTGYDPHDDPRNMEPCDLCHGTGTRSWSPEDEARKVAVLPGEVADPPITETKLIQCNGCEGKGSRLKWPSEWPDVGNVCPTSQVPPTFTPFAVLTPDGQWHEKGRMHMFATVEGGKPHVVWADEVKSLLAAHQDTTAVIVDLHIVWAALTLMPVICKILPWILNLSGGSF